MVITTEDSIQELNSMKVWESPWCKNIIMEKQKKKS